MTTGAPNKVANKPVGHGLAGFSDFCTYKKTAPMSEAGQKAKYSLRAHIVRFAPESRLKSDIAGGPFRAMCGRLRFGKSFLDVLQHWSVQPCVRPFDAVHMTAGHNALRGSGPDQHLAFKNALAHVGCPDRRIDRLCITCCSPSQPSHHAGCPARSRYAASATSCL